MIATGAHNRVWPLVATEAAVMATRTEQETHSREFYDSDKYNCQYSFPATAAWNSLENEQNRSALLSTVWFLFYFIVKTSATQYKKEKNNRIFLAGPIKMPRHSVLLSRGGGDRMIHGCTSRSRSRGLRGTRVRC